jgi:steroid delta-isomerase-like uncharacterized protein
MLPEEMEEVLIRYWGALKAHDVDGALAYCAEDCRYENVPQGLRVEGRDELARVSESFFDAFPDLEFGPEGLAYGRNTTVVWGSMRGTHLGEFVSVEGTGRRFEVPLAMILGFDKGFVCSGRSFVDVGSICDQLGIRYDRVETPG